MNYALRNPEVMSSNLIGSIYFRHFVFTIYKAFESSIRCELTGNPPHLPVYLIDSIIHLCFKLPLVLEAYLHVGACY